MKFSIQAMLNFGSKGAEKVKTLTDRIRENLERASISANKIDKGMYSTGSGDMNAGPNQGATYRGQRGITGQRGAEARNFSGLASMARSETGGFVAAYATIAANLFAVTAAFQALSNAAQTEQLAKGLELVGARAGRALPPVAKNLQILTDNALSYAESMKVVAQATAAGFKQEEIERLATVARGASVALGRDMTDSIDRLTRGTIKLEPELLDEIGIMTRLDEAVRLYAEANGKVVSSLTQTERRQAFLNAVLAEGERKFGDVSEQISSNPYDQLVASIRDLGTGFLNLLNKALVPLVKLLADMPGLAIVPLLGIMTTAGSKVLPNLGTAFNKVVNSIDMLNERMESSRNFIGSTQTDINKIISSLDSASGGLRGTGISPVGLALSPDDDPAVIKNYIAQVRAAKQTLYRQDTVANATQLKELNAIEQQLLDALGIKQAMVNEQRVLNHLTKQETTQRIMRNRIETAGVELNQGQIGAALGVGLSGVKDDAKALIKGNDSLIGSFARLGSGIVTVGRIVGSVFMAATFWIGVAVTVTQVLYTLIKSLGTDAEKAYKKADKALKDYADNVKETAIQLEKMLEIGKDQRYLAVDALNSSLVETADQLRNIIKLLNAANASGVKAGTNASRAFDSNAVYRGTRGDLAGQLLTRSDDGNFMAENGQKVSSFSYKNISKRTEVQDLQKNNKLSQEQAKLASATLDSLEQILPKEAERLRLTIRQGMSQEDTLSYLESQFRVIGEVEASYKEIADIANEISVEVGNWLPKAIETRFSKVNSQVQELDKVLTKIGSGDALSGGQAGLALDSDTIASFQNTILKDNTREAQELLTARLRIEDTDAKIARLNMQIKYAVTDTLREEKEREKLKLVEQREAELKSFGQILFVLRKVLSLSSSVYELSLQEEESNKLKAQSLAKRMDMELEIYNIRVKGLKEERDHQAAVALQGRQGSSDPRLAAIAAIKDRKEAIQLQKEESRVTLSNLYEINKAEKASLETQKIEAAKDKNAVNALQTRIDLIDLEYNKQVKLEGAKTQAAEQELRRQRELVEALNMPLAVEGRRLETLEKTLALRKEENELLSSISSQEAELRSSQKKLDTLASGTSISSQENRNLEKLVLEDRREALQKERELALDEYNLKMALLALEQKVVLEQIKQLKVNADAQGIQDLNNIETEVTDAFNQVLGSSSRQASLIKEKYDNEVKILDLQDRLLSRDPMEDRLNYRRNNFGGQVAGALMPEGMRGYMDEYAQDAGGWSKLLEDPAALEKAKQASEELARMDLVAQGLQDTFSALENGFAEAFEGIITGSKSVKQAFADLALGLLKAVAQMIAKMIAFQVALFTMDTLFPGSGRAFVAMMGGGATPSAGASAGPASSGGGWMKMGAAGGIIPLASGGVMDRSLGVQGVVRQPTYLVGEGKYNEAVVPLPNGRAIPVQMHGGAGNSNSVQVNVNISNDGNVQTETQGDDMGNLGMMVANAVQKELMAQKAPGGILSRYGAA